MLLYMRIIYSPLESEGIILFFILRLILVLVLGNYKNNKIKYVQFRTIF
jgi:hypothetical protein